MASRIERRFAKHSGDWLDLFFEKGFIVDESEALLHPKHLRIPRPYAGSLHRDRRTWIAVPPRSVKLARVA